MDTKYLMIMVAFMLLISFVANDVGLTADVISPPEEPKPPDGLWDSVKSAFTYVFNVIGSLLQLMSFQAELPTFINVLFIMPMSFGIFYLIIKLIRGV